MKAEPMHVLLVEDDQDHAEIIRRALGRQDPPISVSVVTGGPACLSVLQTEAPAAVLLDYSLPGMTGLEVLSRIRAAQLTVPVIMVTGQGDERVAVQAMKSGAADYVLKTSGYAAALPTVVHKVLKQHELAQENQRLYAETQRRLRESEALLDLARTLTSTLEYQPLLTAVAGTAARVCGMDRGSICLWEDGRIATVISRSAGTDDEPGDSLDELAGRPMSGIPLLEEVARSRAPVVIGASAAGSRVTGVLALERATAVMALPLVRHTEVFGALVLHNVRAPHAVCGAQVRIGSTVAAQVSLAVENARLYRAAEQALADLKATQERLVRGQTLRALGELASGAAHHLNNLLAVVLGRTQLMLADRELGPARRRSLEIIERASNDGAEVVRRIQEFARMKTLEAHEPIDLNELMAEVVEMMSARWRDAARAHGVSIDVVCEPGAIPRVIGHPASLREMLTSLLFNAIDAVPRGGRITLRTWREADAVLLCVDDDGVGMPDEVRQRAQEPFFTTKGPKSTGLGLSVAGSIVKRHGGELGIESAAGRGTSVTIRLPADRSTPATAACQPPDDTTRALSILVLDDEDEVREVIALLLESDGHTVEQAGLPSEALARLGAGALPDVVLTDLCMPEMTGWEVACAVKERWPGVTVGLVTGWGENPAPSAKAEAAVDFVIGKPVDRRTIRDCLLTRRAVGAPQAF
jgi:signal transduction histidine kinase/DNA-binding response OmpR family regulator